MKSAGRFAPGGSSTGSCISASYLAHIRPPIWAMAKTAHRQQTVISAAIRSRIQISSPHTEHLCEPLDPVVHGPCIHFVRRVVKDNLLRLARSFEELNRLVL